MSFGKTVELFFVNGMSDGLVTATLSNWNGSANIEYDAEFEVEMIKKVLAKADGCNNL